MKTRLIEALTLIFIVSTVGCTSARSPVTAEPHSNTTGLGEGVILGGSAVAGAAAGYAIRKDAVGAAVGAGTGLVLGAIGNNLIADSKAHREAELIEASKREERVKLEGEYWNAERYEHLAGAAEIPSKSTVAYQGGYFEGVNVAPRRASSEAVLDEPKRP